MKLWKFKNEQEPDCTMNIKAVTYEGAYSKLKYLVQKIELWELNEMINLY